MRGADRQTLPTKIIIETEADYFRLLKRKREFDAFMEDITLIRSRLPELEAWLDANPLQVIKYHELWAKLLFICEYFKATPTPRLYIRQLPVPVHTKFIEQHEAILKQLLDNVLPSEAIYSTEFGFVPCYGLRSDEALVRFRLLDPTLQHMLNLPFDDLAVPGSRFATFDLSPRRCVIVENKMNFLTLPAMMNTFGIFGSGFTVVDTLVDAQWLAKCAIYYWGDLDAQGFQILSMLRRIFPHVVSLMMDEQTIATFRDRVREGRESKILDLPYLTLEEQSMYEQLVAQNSRLEQEQIDYQYVLARFEMLP